MENDKEVNITYETLFEMLRREKDKEELQKLSDSFFSDVIAYLEDKKKAVNDVTLESFGERKKLEGEFDNIRKILKDLYERREKKIVNLALNISRTKSNLIDTSALLNEEKELFDSLIQALDSGRENIVNMLLESKLPSFEKVKTDESVKSEETNVEVPKEETAGTQGVSKGSSLSETPKELSNESEEGLEMSEKQGFSEHAQKSSISDMSKTSQKAKPEEGKTTKMVRFVNAVPKFVGKELEEYGPFEEEDVANLPKEIANVLIEKSRAEEIEER